LDDASTTNEFSADEYVRKKHARSILCLPLVTQASLKGALYLENNLASHVFTPDRISVLGVLVAQASISLNHVRLIAELTQENNDRKKAETALRESEERWRQLFENSSAGIHMASADGHIVAANLAFQKMLGYTQAELQDLTISELTPEEDRADTAARMAVCLQGRRRDYRVERRYCRKDGGMIWADVSVGFIPRPTEGTPGFFMAVIVDITERKRAENELQRKETSLREAQTELAHVSRLTTMGELAASIAHEVNQPLAAVVNNASACLRWLAAQNLEEARQSAAVVIADGHRAGEIIGRIRALAKKTPPQKDWLDLNETVGEVIAIAGSEVQRNHVSLRTELAPDLPRVPGDRVQLQQVILNLLINAIEAMRGVDEGPRELWISSGKVPEMLVHRPRAPQTGESKEAMPAERATAEAEWTHVLITVRDSGPGLDPNGLDRLFNAFYTTKPQGMGMGLAISRSIIEAHGGRLWATANVPRGAAFQFALPIREKRVS
jgi:PAS domain S-box-containing protein